MLSLYIYIVVHHSCLKSRRKPANPAIRQFSYYLTDRLIVLYFSIFYDYLKNYFILLFRNYISIFAPFF